MHPSRSPEAFIYTAPLGRAPKPVGYDRYIDREELLARARRESDSVQRAHIIASWHERDGLRPPSMAARTESVELALRNLEDDRRDAIRAQRERDKISCQKLLDEKGLMIL